MKHTTGSFGNYTPQAGDRTSFLNRPMLFLCKCSSPRRPRDFADPKRRFAIYTSCGASYWNGTDVGIWEVRGATCRQVCNQRAYTFSRARDGECISPYFVDQDCGIPGSVQATRTSTKVLPVSGWEWTGTLWSSLFILFYFVWDKAVRWDNCVCAVDMSNRYR